MKEYTLTERAIGARLRSRRLREAGTSTSATASTGADTSAATVQEGSSHTHANKSDLDKLSVRDGYVEITESVVSGENDARTTVTTKSKSGWADESGALSPESEDWEKILRSDKACTAHEKITFEKGISAKGLSDMEALSAREISTEKATATASMTAPVFIGDLRGNAKTSTILQTARKIWGKAFDGSSDVSGDLMLGTGNIYGADDKMLIDNGGTGIGLMRDTYAHGTMGTEDYASGTRGWRVSHGGAADFRDIRADELRVQSFTADIAQAISGSDYLTKSVSKMAENFTIPAEGESGRMIVDDTEGNPGIQCFADGDHIRLRLFDRRGSGLTIANAWGTVTIDTTWGDGGFSGGKQAYTFSCTSTTDSGGTVNKGSEVLDYGKSGDGLIMRTTLDKAGSPYSQVVTWRDDPGDTGNYDIRTRTGSLAGISGCSGWGFYGENTYLTKQVTVGDLGKKGNYMEYDAERGMHIVADAFYIKTRTTPVPRDLGEWQQGWTCAYYDRVSHVGSLWLCTSASGTTAEPSPSSPDWEEQVEKGEQGEKGDSTISVTIYTTEGNILRNGQQQTTLMARVTKGNTDVTDSMADSLFSWTRNSGNSATDAIFDSQHAGYGKTLTLTCGDVDRKSTYDCLVNTDTL